MKGSSKRGVAVGRTVGLGAVFGIAEVAAGHETVALILGLAVTGVVVLALWRMTLNHGVKTGTYPTIARGWLAWHHSETTATKQPLAESDEARRKRSS